MRHHCVRHLYSVVFLIVFFLASPLLAQKEYNHWYFGFGSHLDFSFSPPSLDDIGKTESIEGSASISDPVSGGLLFYTDGLTVWNRQHTPMPNGTDLFSNRSSTQAALIIPDPADSKLYYVFTVDQSGYLGPTRGLNYSVVDMRLNGGLGDVTRKNINIIPLAAEKITAVRLCEGSAYWIIGHGLNDNIFYAWYLDRNGLSTNPVQSPVGSVLGPDGNAGIGWLSASPDGKMLASTLYESDLPGMGNSLEMFQFDPQTGIVSSPISTNDPVDAYGVSFSPDNSKLYVSTGTAIEQYTVAAWSNGAVLNSRIILSSDGLGGGALKIGLNGRIYVQHSTYLGVIANPNAGGLACNYNPRAMLLPDEGQSYGLPNNIDARVENVCGPPLALIKIHPTLMCEGTCIDFRDSSRYGPDVWKWTFQGGIPSSHEGRTPPKICYETPGKYEVQLIVENESGSDTTTRLITVMECQEPVVALQDTTICMNECIAFIDTSIAPGDRKWTFEGGTPASHNGKTPSAVCYKTKGRYKTTLIASNSFGVDTAIAYVTVLNCDPPSASFVHDTVICIGSDVSFTNTSTGEIESSEWSFENGTPSSSSVKDPTPIAYNTLGRHRVTLITTNDNGSDTAYSWVTVEKCDKPKAILSNYTLCAEDCIDLRDSSLNGPTSWQWITEGGDKTSFTVQHPRRVCYTIPGTYTLQLIASNASGSDTIVRTVTVLKREGWSTQSVTFSEPIAACLDHDTTITFYAGCAASTFSNLRSSSDKVVVMQTSGNVAANDSVKVAIRISAANSGPQLAELRVTIDGKDVVIPVSYTVIEDQGQFIISRFDSTFSTIPCISLDHDLVLSNLSCASKRITEIVLDPSTGAAFSLSSIETPFDIMSGDSTKVTVSFDPDAGGSQTGILVIRTNDGLERRITLLGESSEVTKAQLSLSTTDATNLTAGDLVSYSLIFDSSVDASRAPEQIDLALDYNTDLLALTSPLSEAGWAIDSYSEVTGKLTATLKRTKQQIASGEKLLTLSFKTFLAKEDSTQLAISGITCNAGDPDFEKCILLVVPGASSHVTVGAECGGDEMRYTMGKTRRIMMTVRPNPVANSDGTITVDLESRAPDNAQYNIDLIDVMGRSLRLHTGTLSHSVESFTLPLASGMHGLCFLRLTSEHETIFTPLLIR